MKLFRVKLRGVSSFTGIDYSCSYVVAQNSDDAYKKVRKFLDDKDLCFSCDREMKSVELIADDAEYCAVRTLLFL